MNKSTLLFLTPLFALACTVDTEAQGGAQGALAPEGPNDCALVTPEAFAELYGTVQDALVRAELEAAAQAGGADPVAAAGARDAFAEAARKLEAQQTWFAEEGDADPGTISVNEAIVTGRVAWGLSDDLHQAAHWATVSAIDNQSEDSRTLVEDALLAIEQAQALEVHGTRCYLRLYLP